MLSRLIALRIATEFFIMLNVISLLKENTLVLNDIAVFVTFFVMFFLVA